MISTPWQDLAEGRASVPVAVDRIDAIGPDTVKFLHSLVSQNISALGIGEGAWTFLLQPQGKVTSFAYALRFGDEHVVLLTEPGFGEALHTALSRYRIRTKCDLALNTNSAANVSFVNAAPSFAVTETPEPFLHGQTNGPEAYNTARIVNGWPVQPNEMNDRTIPNETGVLGEAVNFTKGCYIGQELVERIDSRGATTPRRLVRLVGFVNADGVTAEGATPDEVGSESWATKSPASVADGSNIVGLNPTEADGDVERARKRGWSANSLVGSELGLRASADRETVSAHEVAAKSDSDSGPEAPTAKAVGSLTSVVADRELEGGLAGLAYVARSVEDGSKVTIIGTSFSATVTALRAPVTAPVTQSSGVRSTATMGRKA